MVVHGDAVVGVGAVAVTFPVHTVLEAAGRLDDAVLGFVGREEVLAGLEVFLPSSGFLGLHRGADELVGLLRGHGRIAGLDVGEGLSDLGGHVILDALAGHIGGEQHAEGVAQGVILVFHVGGGGVLSVDGTAGPSERKESERRDEQGGGDEVFHEVGVEGRVNVQSVSLDRCGLNW